MSVRRRASGRAHYNYFRDYDPAVGRYVESDPIGLVGGIATYSYGLSNPAMEVDKQGLIVSFGNFFMKKLQQWWSRCNSKEEQWCKDLCVETNRIYVSCRARVIKVKEIWDGVEVPKVVRKFPPSCRCDDPETYCPGILVPGFSPAPGVVPGLMPGFGPAGIPAFP